MASKSEKWKGRVEGAADRCGVAGCGEPGEFRAPLSPGDFDGPGRWHYLCLEHVRAHNSRYNYFAGMSPEEISAAQSPIAGWERASRPFATQGRRPAAGVERLHRPARRDRGALPARVARGAVDRFTPGEREALGVMGLKDDVDRTGAAPALFGTGAALPPRPQRRRPQPRGEARQGDRRLSDAQGRAGVR